jgi:hypothetical protein
LGDAGRGVERGKIPDGGDRSAEVVVPVFSRHWLVGLNYYRTALKRGLKLRATTELSSGRKRRAGL